MFAIWKFPFNKFPHRRDGQCMVFEIELPKEHTPLHVHDQDDDIVLWALCRTTGTEKVKRRFAVFPTGGELSRESWGAQYVGTVHMPAQRLVWHVFELPA